MLDKQEQFYFSLACFLLELITKRKKKTLHLRDKKHAGFFLKIVRTLKNNFLFRLVKLIHLPS